MALLQVNGLPCFDAQEIRPRTGAWLVDMRVDNPDAITGQVEIVVNGGARTLKGTATNSGDWLDVAQLRVVAGANGLGSPARPQSYNATTLGVVLRDILSAAGEALAASADGGVLGTALEAWTVLGRPAGVEVAALFAVAAPAAAWRFLDDGTLWCGPETWPDAGVDPTTYQVLDMADDDLWMEIAVESPLDLIGKVIEGGRVSWTQGDVPHVDGVKMRVLFEPDDDKPGRAIADLAAIVRAVPPGVDLRFPYLADVVDQASGLVDATPGTPGVPEGQAVQLLAQAGDSVDGVEGGQVALEWAGDGTKPIARGFTAGAVPARRGIAVSQFLSLGVPAGAPPAVVGAIVAAVTAFFAAIDAAAGVGLAVPPVDPSLVAFYGALQAAFAAFESAAAAANGFLSTKVGVSP